MLLTRVLGKVSERRVVLVRMKHIWTVDRTVRSPFDDVAVPEETITEHVWKNLDKWSNKTAVVSHFVLLTFT